MNRAFIVMCDMLYVLGGVESGEGKPGEPEVNPRNPAQLKPLSIFLKPSGHCGNLTSFDKTLGQQFSINSNASS